MREHSGRLRDILEALDRIDERTPATRDALAADALVQVWVVHHLRIIGEAVAALPPEVRAGAPEIPWASIVGMRNVLVHQYFAVDVAAVWDVLRKDLGPLRAAVERLLAARSPDG